MSSTRTTASGVTAHHPLRESSIPLASAWGAVRLRETTDHGEAASARIVQRAASARMVQWAVVLALG